MGIKLGTKPICPDLHSGAAVDDIQTVRLRNGGQSLYATRMRAGSPKRLDDQESIATAYLHSASKHVILSASRSVMAEVQNG